MSMELGTLKISPVEYAWDNLDNILHMHSVVTSLCCAVSYHCSGAGHGSLYISDSSGTYYSKVLDNHVVSTVKFGI